MGVPCEREQFSYPQENASKKGALLSMVLLLFFILISNVSAQNNNNLLFKPELASEERKSRIEVTDTTQTNNYRFDVNIFGDGILGVPFILLWENENISSEMKTILSSRNFAKDEFFMQNIDREQFEQERLLQLFEDKKREYFLIFPEEALKELEEDY